MCPRCGTPAKLHRYNEKYQYECDLCWIKGRVCPTEEEAAESWNAIKPKPEMQRCPNCGCSADIHNRNHKYWHECNGCWTQGDKCSSVEEARESWNSIKPKPKKTNLELLQEAGIANFAAFLQSWEENRGSSWADMTEDEIINWLASSADSELDAIANF